MRKASRLLPWRYPQGGSGIRLALNASAPSYRFRPSDVREACSALKKDAAAELARNLG